MSEPEPITKNNPIQRTRNKPDFYGESVCHAVTNYEALTVNEHCGGEKPKNVSQALKDPNWKKALEDEYASLIQNEVWDVIEMDKSKSIIGGKWKFKTKYDADGNISRYKARFVAKGYSQQHGIDFTETYCPTVKLTTLRTILAYAAHKGMIVNQMDIKTAYLNAELDEEVYMHQP